MKKIQLSSIEELTKISIIKLDTSFITRAVKAQLILESAIAKGVIRKDRTQYYYGTELFADSLQDAISYLDAKKNQDLKLSIINQVENK